MSEIEYSCSQRFAVVLTATIFPKGTLRNILARSDPEIRRRDYEAALRFWLQVNAPWLGGIIFAENSGSSLESLKTIVARENSRAIPVEFLSYDYPPPPEGLHYGYSEFLLFRQAVAESSIASQARFLIKATGRYRFPDIARLIHKLPCDFKAAVDCKYTNIFTRNRHYLTHFTLAMFERQFFVERLWDIPELMVPAPPWTRSQFVETVLFDRLSRYREDHDVILRWPCNCEAEGVGASGDDYTKVSKRAKAAIRAAGRVVAPGIWL